MKVLKNQSGSMVLEIVLLVLALGVVGYIFYGQVTHKKSAQLPAKTPVATKSSSPSPAKDDGYLVFKDYGVKLKLPAGITALEYVVDGKYIRLGSTQIDALAGSKGTCLAKGSALGTIVTSDTTLGQEDSGVEVKVGNKYFKYYEPQGLCVDSIDTSAGALQVSTTANIKKNFATMLVAN